MSDINLNERYPKAVTLPDGATVEIRLMNATDRDAMLSFARSLPQ